jgi:hypothetical protein
MGLQTKVTKLIQNPADNKLVSQEREKKQLTKHYVHKPERVSAFTSVSQPAEHGSENKCVH